MKTVLLLTKEDVNIGKIGFHYEINTSDGTSINFNPEAFSKLIKDIYQIKKEEMSQTENEQ